MSRHRVSCINKRGDHYDAHERISHIGGTDGKGERWRLPEDEAIRSIENGKYEFYVVVKNVEAEVVIAVHNGRKYLKTKPDGYAPNNLLSLPECP
jgi:hypothetical protein